MKYLVEQFKKIGLIPVVTLEEAAAAAPLAEALRAGGLPAAEITFRTNAAIEALSIAKKAAPDLLIGAGTILSAEQADAAMEAGAQFLISPGLIPSLAVYCKEKQYPLIPGISTASELEQARALGFTVLKFFPAEAAGGAKMLSALGAPYQEIRFMPTGGIHPCNLRAYLDLPNVMACGGSWMVPATMIKAGDFDGIRRLTQEAVAKMLDFSLAHVGINCADDAAAKKDASLFSALFHQPLQELPVSFFAGDGIELMKSMGDGRQGHLGIGTADVDRAAAYLERCGVSLRWDSALYDQRGTLRFIYLKEEMAGFAVHLTKKQPGRKNG